MNKFSENTVPILTGRGLSETRERIERAFAAMRAATQLVAPVPLIEVEVVNVSREEAVARFHARVEQSNICKDESGYTPTEFDRRSERLTAAALMSSHVMSEASRDGVWRISLSGQSAEELIKEALGGPEKTESKRKRA